MKGPVGTEDSDKKSGTVDKSQGVSPDLYIHFPLFVPTGRLIKARHAVPGRDSLESARPEGTPHAGELPMPGAAASNSRRRRPCQTPGTACRAGMKGPDGAEDSSAPAGTV